MTTSLIAREAQVNCFLQKVFFFFFTIMSIQTLGAAYLRMWPEQVSVSIHLVPVVQRKDTIG